MSRRESLRRRVLAIVVLAQLPAAAALALLVHPLAVALPVLATAVFLRAYRGPYAIAPGPLVWAFFVYWVACVAFAVLSPIALASPALAAALALLVGIRSVWPIPRVRTIELAFPDLPAELDGTTIAQLSDLHCGPFVSAARIAAWVRHTNALAPDLVAVTGDLIASGPDYVDAVAAALGGLRAPGGVYAVMGNHDYFGAGEPLVRALETHGLTVLRNAAFAARPGLVVAGVDDTWSGRADLARALGRAPEGFVVLLAHDPALFPAAAERDVPLTLSGHTHGGQLAFPFLRQRWNLGRVVHRFSLGIYRKGRACLHVSPGLGTSGPPVRVGVRPEITLIRLRR